jgi:hypothetical protein
MTTSGKKETKPCSYYYGGRGEGERIEKANFD